MKRMTVIATLLVLAVSTASAQTFDLSWYTIDGGGDMWSTGDAFELSGTIGQPDAGGVMTGGGFELTGGFWAGVAVSPPICIGDLNCDGTYGQGSFGDINPFVQYLSNFSAWQATYPGCDPRVGDLNCDGSYGQGSFGDINPFVQYLSNFSSWQATYPACSPANGDINSDGTYGQASFGDINPYVALLSSQPLPIVCP